MTALDPKTVMALASALGAVMAAVLYLLKRSYPPSIHGIGLWALAMALTFVGGGLFATTGTLHPLLSTTLASLMVYLSPYVSLVGTQRFFGVRSKHLPWALAIGLAFATSVWFTYGTPDYGRRLQLSSMVLITLCVAQGTLIWRHTGKTLAGRVAMGVLACMGAVQLMRFVTTFTAPTGLNALDASPANVIYLAGFAFVIVLISISHVLLATDRLRSQLEHAATHDSLTDAYTRRYMNEALQRELARSQRHRRVMSVLLLDIDHFKAVNDSQGHQAGDRVLTQFVARTGALLRGGDLLGRFGGEEFLVLLPETPPDVALRVAERIRAAAGQNASPTVSIGVTTSIATPGAVGSGDSITPVDTLDAIIARADAAMYRAKARGRNRVEVG